MQFKDYYQTLGVSPTATAAEIKTAYRKLARKYHPDVSKEAEAEERFKAINEAYEALRDDDKRQAYDQLRAQGFRPGEEFRPPPGFGSGFRFDTDQDAGSGFSDFFESLFGRARAGQQQRTQRGAEKARVEVDLATVFSGGTQRVSVRGKLLEVRIPKGIAAGQNIRLAGQGQHGADLLLQIHYRAHPQFSVDGRDLTCRVTLKPWDAGLGCEVKVPTLAGEVNLRIPPGTGSGRKLRLKGRGLPVQSDTETAGDQFVEVMVEAPAAKEPAQIEAYQQLRQSFGG